jgi:hypothetical protein
MMAGDEDEVKSTKKKSVRDEITCIVHLFTRSACRGLFDFDQETRIGCAINELTFTVLLDIGFDASLLSALLSLWLHPLQPNSPSYFSAGETAS